MPSLLLPPRVQQFGDFRLLQPELAMKLVQVLVDMRGGHHICIYIYTYVHIVHVDVSVCVYVYMIVLYTHLRVYVCVCKCTMYTGIR